jgi:hypothetical protein
VFCEAPAKTLGDVEEMAAVEADGQPVGLVLRFPPVFTVLKSLMSEPHQARPDRTLQDDQFFHPQPLRQLVAGSSSVPVRYAH